LWRGVACLVERIVSRTKPILGLSSHHVLMNLLDSPFAAAPRSHLNPHVSPVQKPAKLPLNSLPQRSPTSQSSNQASKALHLSFQDAGSAKTAPSLEREAAAAGQMCVLRETQSVSRSLQRQRPSVADLRESFERISRPAEKESGPKTPVKLRTSMSTSICYTDRKNIDCSLGDTRGSSRRPIATPDQSPSCRVESTTCPVISTGAELTTKPSLFIKQGPPSRSYPALPCLTPLALPTGKSSWSRLSMFAKSKPENPSSREDKTGDVYVQPHGADTTKAIRHSGNDFPHSSPIHPLLLSGSEATAVAEMGVKPDPINERISLSDATLPDPNCWIEEFGTDVDLSLPTEVHSSPQCEGQPPHRPNKVADLRRLFDRSSSRPLAGFHRQKQTLPNLGLSHLNLDRDESPTPPGFAAPSPTSQKPGTPPALTTEIGINDFSCSFMDGDAAHLYTSSPAKSKPRRDLLPESLARTSCESFLQQRIIKFEHMKSQSESEDSEIHSCQAQRRKHILTSDSSPLDASGPIPVVPKPGRKGHPVRSVWRRISNSFTQSFDGSDNYSHSQVQSRYRSSYQESSHDYTGSPPSRNQLPSLRASRKSFPLLQRLSSRGSSHIFGMDGGNHSTPNTALENCTLSRVDSPNNTPRPEQEDLQKPSRVQTPSDHKVQKKAQKRAEKLEKQGRRERRRWRRIEKDLEKHTPLNMPRVSSGAPATLAVPVGDVKEQERSWGKQTSSGFMVRQADLGSQELVHPRPDRPGQVRKIVDLYKEKSSSMLRIASGHLSIGRGRTRDGGSDAKDKRQAKQTTEETGSTG
jgi:hypothetical protein